MCALFTLLSACEPIKQCNVTLGNVVILGDSYSTFEGHIPQGYASWYSKDASYTDVNSAEQTWWNLLIKATNSTLVINSSYSGSAICNTGYDKVDATDTSFLTRLSALKNTNVQLDKIDTLIIYGGLNDCWAGVPLGEINYDTRTADDLYKLFPAVIELLNNAREIMPNARIIFVIEEYLTEEIKQGFEEICKNMDVETITTHDVDKTQSHPNCKGMRSICNQIIDYLESTK